VPAARRPRRVLPPGVQATDSSTTPSAWRSESGPPTLASVLAAAVLTTWSPDNLDWREATTRSHRARQQLGWVELAMEPERLRRCTRRGRVGRADDDFAMVEAGWPSRRPLPGAGRDARSSRALLKAATAAPRWADVMLARPGTTPISFLVTAPNFSSCPRPGPPRELDSLVKVRSTFPNIRVAGRRPLIDATRSS
jgi:hypothetical protein